MGPLVQPRELDHDGLVMRRIRSHRVPELNVRQWRGNGVSNGFDTIPNRVSNDKQQRPFLVGADYSFPDSVPYDFTNVD